MPFYMASIPSFLEVFGVCVIQTGLSFTAGSVYQMLRASTVLVVALCSIAILRKRYFSHHWLALTLVFIAMIFVGWSGLSTTGKNPTKPLGVILVIFGNFLFSLNVIIQELLFRKFKTKAMKFSGLEGFFGTIYLGTVVIILGFIPCEGENAKIECFNGTFVNTWKSFKVIFHTPIIIWLYLGFMVSASFMKISSVYLVKSTSATARMTIDASWMMLVWIFFLSWQGEKEHESFNLLQLIGFLFLTTGTLIFNEIVILPLLGLHLNTKQNLAKKQAEEDKVQLLKDDQKSTYALIHSKLQISKVLPYFGTKGKCEQFLKEYSPLTRKLFLAFPSICIECFEWEYNLYAWRRQGNWFSRVHTLIDPW